jgi:hypothetical protein
MSKNKLSDLNDHLFEALEWLSDRDLKGEALKEEVIRTRMKCEAAKQIIAGGRLVLDAAKIAKLLPEGSKRRLLPE